MTLFTIAKLTLESNGWKAPVASVSASPDDNMKQVLALANKEILALAFRRTWPILVKDNPIVTMAGQSDYDLPVDFHHIVNPSVYYASQYYTVKGNLQPLEYIRYVNNLVGPNSSVTGYRIQQKIKKIRLIPTPATDGEQLVYFYVSKNLVVGSDGNEKILFSQDDDTSLIDEDLVELGLNWRWREKKGMEYSAEIMEYKGAVDQRYAQYLALPEFPIGGHPMGDAPLTDGYVQGPFG